MTKITIYRDKEQNITGFCCEGHAGYANAGSDIVCAGISVLVENTVNAIEAYTDTPFSCNTDEKSGRIDFRLKEAAGHDAELLLKAMLLGLSGIESSYGKKFLKLQFKEV